MGAESVHKVHRGGARSRAGKQGKAVREQITEAEEEILERREGLQRGYYGWKSGGQHGGT